MGSGLYKVFSELNCSGVEFWTPNTGPGKALNFEHVPVPRWQPFPCGAVAVPAGALGHKLLPGCRGSTDGLRQGGHRGGTGLSSGCRRSPALPGVYVMTAAAFLRLPRSPRRIRAAKRGVRMETRCPAKGVSSDFLADQSHLSVSHLLTRCPGSGLTVPRQLARPAPLLCGQPGIARGNGQKCPVVCGPGGAAWGKSHNLSAPHWWGGSPSL